RARVARCGPPPGVGRPAGDGPQEEDQPHRRHDQRGDSRPLARRPAWTVPGFRSGAPDQALRRQLNGGTTMPDVINSPKTTRGTDFLWPRGLNIVLGIWLFISAFLWPHFEPQFTNTWLLGIICVAAAVVALRVPWFRYVNTALAIWLFISAFVMRP